jgi:hypothetical protein
MASAELRRPEAAGRRVPRLHGFELAGHLKYHFTRSIERLAGALRAVLPDLLAIELLVAVDLFVFRDALVEGLLFHEADTTTMFYPVFATLAEALPRGDRLLWTPYMFSGFPLLAEGQTGVLYPLNWAAVALLPTDQAFVWLRVAHLLIALLGAYLLGRALWLGPPAALVLALSFSLGSFVVGQLQHASVIASTVWLPYVLALLQLSFRASGGARVRYLLLSGLTLGLAALGVHIQTVVLSAGCFVAWTLFLAVLPPRAPAPVTLLDASAREAPWTGRRPQARRLEAASGPLVWLTPWKVRAVRRGAAWLGRGAHSFLAERMRSVSLAAAALVVVPATAMAVAAGQLLPLYELSTQSGRAAGWTYQAATDYSLPVQNLLTLIFPSFFRDGRGGGWSLWQPWEVTYYAGVVPLVLAALGLLFCRRRPVIFFAGLVVIASLLALGDYSPLNLYSYLWSLPGFNLQRAPARFSYLGVLGIATLAGFGTQLLGDRLRTTPAGSKASARFLVVWLAGVMAALIALIWHLVAWRAWLESDPLWAMQIIESSYLSLRRDPGVVDSAQKVYSGLWRSLDITNRETAASLLFVATLVVLVFCWSELRRARGIWQAALVLLVATDLGHFAQSFHPLVSIADVASIGDVGQFLVRQGGLVRVFTHPDVKRPRPNQLLPWEVAELSAYDPLELSRHGVYLGMVSAVDNWLLDLLGVRFRVVPSAAPSVPSYRQTGFDPQHPLLLGRAGSPSGQEAWTVPGAQADELRVVSAVEDAFALRDGDVVAEWVLTDDRGRQRRLPMVAGRDSAEWTYDDPALDARPAHTRASVAFSYEQEIPASTGARQVNLYYSAFTLPDRPTIKRAELRVSGSGARFRLYGFGLFNRDRSQMAQFFPREKYRAVFQADGVRVDENRAVFPRFFVVRDSVLVNSAQEALELLADGPLRPHQEVVLEQDDPGVVAESDGGSGAPPESEDQPYGQATLVDAGDEELAIQASAPEGGYLVVTDAHYPGWTATVDGEDADILRADYLFRAVRLPPGDHFVQLRYQPRSFETGLTIARLALALVMLGLLVSFASADTGRPSGWLRTP